MQRGSPSSHTLPRAGRLVYKIFRRYVPETEVSIRKYGVFKHAIGAVAGEFQCFQAIGKWLQFVDGIRCKRKA